MKIVYTGESFPNEVEKSIFLAGPTPRTSEVASWRVPDALAILERLGYDGHVFAPEDPPGSEKNSDFDAHYYKPWETEGLNRADLIVFWVPRELKTMPAFTTNVEWGRWAPSGKVLFGAPPDAPRNDYLRLETEEFSVPQFSTLERMLAYAVERLGKGAKRVAGETCVPLHVWETESFQAWYKSLRAAGNRLERARVLWTYQAGPQKSFLFAWVLKVEVWVEREQRRKINEFVLSRSDVASVMLWHERPNPFDSEIILVREFRSPARTPDGFVHELPGGSSFGGRTSPNELAWHEAQEETGFSFNPRRLTPHGTRQVAGTLSSHHAHLFSLRLTAEELRDVKMRAEKNIPCGNIEDSERTYLEVRTLGKILDEKREDWATIGMILNVVFDER